MKNSLCLILSFGVIAAFSGRSVHAQPSPFDLTDSVDLSPFSIEEILGNVVVAPDEGVDADPQDMVFKRPWKIRYRYARAKYEGYQNRSRTNLSIADVLEQFPVVPTEIIQESHMLDARTEMSPGWQIGFLVPYIRQSTDHVRRKGAPFNLSSEGLGDVEISLGKSHTVGPQAIVGNIGVSLPTGSIDEKGTTPRGPGTQLPYTMQLGSGTVDVKPSITYVRTSEQMSFGLQALGTLRTGTNDRDYRLGHRYQFTSFVSLPITSVFEPSIKIRYVDWAGIRGEDEELNPDLAPVANARLYGGDRVEGIIGATFKAPGVSLKNAALDVQFAIPLHECLSGPQPGLDYHLSLSAQFNF